ncbi:catechol 2,3-dioxygenase [Oceanobacillus limi]|uniref:Catechol 2,3-dioxygenase n=1 Tax=Oceanobacillus limi TaxID=930131 RepID=A0A1I0B5C7_9BACI|nr:VOC family protein [Oceanobacillus limi]SET01947.1 catechol 2,3-dioxygenase [Oceanobacillus limi]
MEKQFFQQPTIFVKDISINVTNLTQSLNFYQNVLGFHVLSQTNSKVVLTADGETPILSIEQPDNVTPKEPRTTGLYHFAILLPSRADLSAFLKHIIQQGVQLGASDHYVSEALYFNDPDGNGIEVYRDRPSTEWNWKDGQVAMATEPLDGDSLINESEKSWNGMPKETVMGHIHLHVADLKETENFYVNGLGMDIVTNYPGALFASYGGYHHHIGLNVWNGVGAKSPAENSVGLNWLRLVIPNETTREKIIQQLQDIGATVSNENTVEDPAGNRIKLTVL